MTNTPFPEPNGITLTQVVVKEAKSRFLSLSVKAPREKGKAYLPWASRMRTIQYF